MEKVLNLLLSVNLWVSVALIVITFIIWKIIRKLIVKQMNKYDISGKHETDIHITMTFIKIILTILVLAAALQINGINISSLVTGLGVVSIVIGFAVQDILKDLMMGTNIVWDNFFRIGDIVRYKGKEGRIEYFNMKVTKIYDVNTGDTYTVSNRNISEIEAVSDWLDVIIPAPYSVDVDEMREICKKICTVVENNQGVDSCEFLGTDEFAQSQINYRIRLHCPPEQKASMRRMTIGIIQDVYKQEGISVPYPHVVVSKE